MPGRDIIVAGASAGGVEALTKLVSGLPADLPAAVFVVLHIPPTSASVLPQILAKAGPLPAVHAEDGEVIEHGCIYVAPPDHHLLVQRDGGTAVGRVQLTRGPRENNCRPALDTLFRSAARAYGRRVLGVVLSGALDDGTAGLAAIRLRGGMTIVQDPEEAIFPSMPRNAMENVAVDHVLPLAKMSKVLARLVEESVKEGEGPVPDEMQSETEMAALTPEALHRDERPGKPSGFGCPDCGGVLWELQEGDLLHLRCRVGHAYSPVNLLGKQSEAVEEALWMALRALEESAALAYRLTDRARERGHSLVAGRFTAQADDARQRAELIRQVLLGEIGGVEAIAATAR